MPQILWAETALLAEGWAQHVTVEIGGDGKVLRAEPATKPRGQRLGLLLPAPVNLHSHVFQRAMAGLTEARGQGTSDSFWTWRDLMYRFLDHLTPEDVEAIAAMAQLEMLEAGYGAVAEFHYLHHQPDGTPYADPAEMAARVIAAARTTGIGLTLLPVLYQTADCNGAALTGGQRRFGNDLDGYEALLSKLKKPLVGDFPDCNSGVAPHSLRAVPPKSLDALAAMQDGPIHIHVAEQQAEVDEVQEAHGARPVEWLLTNADVDARWCLIHCTQMTPEETSALASSGAVAGLCPVTESNLGDGIFDGRRYLESGGKFGVGTDSNVRISLTDELRTLEYSQRLRDRSRAVLASENRSTGRRLFDAALAGGAQAAARASGTIAYGQWADLVALGTDCPDIAGQTGDTLLDTWIFGPSAPVRDVWSAGRHVVHDGRHVRRERVIDAYGSALARLRAAL